ncbi:MAG: hypothetical protein WCK08_10955 [Betaproteobacteria bacterium]
MSRYRAAPVAYPAGPCRAAALLVACLWGAALALTWAWFIAAGADDRSPWWGLLSLVTVTLGLVGYWRRIPTGQLSWDGQAWLWTSRAYPAGAALTWPDIVIDLQYFVVIRTRNPAGASWTLWLEARSQPLVWHSLRLALHARPASTASPEGPGSIGA